MTNFVKINTNINKNTEKSPIFKKQIFFKNIISNLLHDTNHDNICIYKYIIGANADEDKYIEQSYIDDDTSVVERFKELANTVSKATVIKTIPPNGTCQVKDCFSGFFIPGMNNFIDSAETSLASYMKFYQKEYGVDFKLPLCDIQSYGLGDNNFKYTYSINYDMKLYQILVDTTKTIEEIKNIFVEDVIKSHSSILNVFWQEVLNDVFYDYSRQPSQSPNQINPKEIESALNILRQIRFSGFEFSNNKKNNGLDKFGSSKLFYKYPTFRVNDKDYPFVITQRECALAILSLSSDMSAYVEPRKSETTDEAKKKCIEGIFALFQPTHTIITKCLVFMLLKYAGDTSHLTMCRVLQSETQSLNNEITSVTSDGDKDKITCKLFLDERPLFVRGIQRSLSIFTKPKKKLMEIKTIEPGQVYEINNLTPEQVLMKNKSDFQLMKEYLIQESHMKSDIYMNTIEFIDTASTNEEGTIIGSEFVIENDETIVGYMKSSTNNASKIPVSMSELRIIYSHARTYMKLFALMTTPSINDYKKNIQLFVKALPSMFIVNTSSSSSNSGRSSRRSVVQLTTSFLNSSYFYLYKSARTKKGYEIMSYMFHNVLVFIQFLMYNEYKYKELLDAQINYNNEMIMMMKTELIPQLMNSLNMSIFTKDNFNMENLRTDIVLSLSTKENSSRYDENSIQLCISILDCLYEIHNIGRETTETMVGGRVNSMKLHHPLLKKGGVGFLFDRTRKQSQISRKRGFDADANTNTNLSPVPVKRYRNQNTSININNKQNKNVKYLNKIPEKDLEFAKEINNLHTSIIEVCSEQIKDEFLHGCMNYLIMYEYMFMYDRKYKVYSHNPTHIIKTFLLDDDISIKNMEINSLLTNPTALNNIPETQYKVQDDYTYNFGYKPKVNIKPKKSNKKTKTKTSRLRNSLNYSKSVINTRKRKRQNKPLQSQSLVPLIRSTISSQLLPSTSNVNRKGENTYENTTNESNIEYNRNPKMSKKSRANQ